MELPVMTVSRTVSAPDPESITILILFSVFFSCPQAIDAGTDNARQKRNSLEILFMAFMIKCESKLLDYRGNDVKFRLISVNEKLNIIPDLAG